MTHLALGKNSLWVTLIDPAGRVRLERRNPATGRVLRTSRLAPKPVALAAGLRGAWVLTAGGDLLLVGQNGRAKRLQKDLAAVAAAGNQLWAIRRDRRTVMNLDPVNAKIRGVARIGARLSSPMAITRENVWVMGETRRFLVRLERT